MKTAFIVVSALIILSIVLLFILAVNSRTGRAPGMVEGRLTNCHARPNCVCSELPDDAGHYIDPLVIPPGMTLDTMPLLRTAILNMGGRIQDEKNNYIAAAFSSSIFGFVDDFEVRVDPDNGVIHLRSASRAGYRDMGVNKVRTELLKKLYYNRVSETDQSL